MSTVEITPVLHALQTIESAPDEALQAYDAEVNVVFQKLRMLIARKDKLVLQSNSPEPTISSPGTFDPVVCLIQALKRTATQIRAYLEKSKTDAIGDKLKSYSDDPRVDDLKLVKSNSSPRIKFRTVLRQRSLALEYINWEIQSFGTSKVTKLVNNPKHSQHRKSGKIHQYLQANRDRFVNTETVRAGIERGIKLLVLENVADTVMTSAIISLCASKFRLIRYNEMRSLGAKLHKIKWIETLTETKTDWFQRCQKHYDAWWKDFHTKKGRRTNQDAGPASSNYASSDISDDTNQMLLTDTDILPPSKHFFSENAQPLSSEGLRSNEELHSNFEVFLNHYSGLGARPTDNVNHSSLHRSTEPQTETFVQRSQNEGFNVYACQGQGFDVYRGLQTDRYIYQRHIMRMGNFVNDDEPTSKEYANTFFNLIGEKEQSAYYLS